MNALEWIAAALGVVNILLVIRRSLWNFPVGVTMVSLYFFVFWDAKLYSDALLQIFFLGIQLYGWWAWSRAERVGDAGVAVGLLGARSRILWGGAVVLAAGAWGSLMASLSDAALPHADGAVAVASIAAQWLQSRRKVECWWLWIAVDIVAIPLFLSRGLWLTAALYALFLILAVVGLIEWRRKVRP